jgi:hypothetical protein
VVWSEFRSSPLAQVSHYGNAAHLKLFLKCVSGSAQRALLPA